MRALESTATAASGISDMSVPSVPTEIARLPSPAAGGPPDHFLAGNRGALKNPTPIPSTAKGVARSTRLSELYRDEHDMSVVIPLTIALLMVPVGQKRPEWLHWFTGQLAGWRTS